MGLLLAASLTLTGCSGLLGGGASGGSGGTSGNGQSGGSGGTDGSGGKPSATAEPSTDDSTGLQGYEGKPPTFPADVPIIDGDVPFGIDLGTGWTVIVKADDLVAAFQSATDKLTAAGYTSLMSSTTDDGSFAAFDNDKYSVQVTATDNSEYGSSLTYLVVLKG